MYAFIQTMDIYSEERVEKRIYAKDNYLKKCEDINNYKR